MAFLVGFHAEGNDLLILKVFLAKLLVVHESELLMPPVDSSGRGWELVLRLLPDALRRFYNQCAQAVVVAVDNDGDVDVQAAGLPEDGHHPRHWNHVDRFNNDCRFCQLEQAVAKVRAELNWLPQKPGTMWPVVIGVPVETIEAWVLLTQSLIMPGRGTRDAESLKRTVLKQRLYGSPAATLNNVTEIALPLLRELEPQHLIQLCELSRSFKLFADQVLAQRAKIVGPPDCWQPGDGAASHPRITG